MSRRVACLLGLVTFVAFAAILAFRLADSRTFQLFGTLVHRVETSERLVALTFDDGPTPTGTQQILDVLRQADVRATFFLTGAEIEANGDLARRLVRAGHELGNHSYSHRRMTMRSPSFFRTEVERTDSLIRLAGQPDPIHFRPPYGKKLVGLPLYLARTGRTTVMWDVEPDSYPKVAADPDAIVLHVVDRTRPGSIILLHVMYPSRAPSLQSVEGIIRELEQRGYRFVTVSELLGARGAPCAGRDGGRETLEGSVAEGCAGSGEPRFERFATSP